MPTWLERLWTPPSFDDDETARVATTTLPVAFSFLVPSLVTLPVLMWLYPDSVWVAAAVLTIAGYPSAIALVHLRRPRTAAWLLLAVGFVAISMVAIEHGGLEGPFLGLYAIITIAAGLLINARAAVAMGAVCVAGTTSLALAAALGWLPETTPLPMPIAWMVVSASVLIASAIAAFTVRTLRERESRLRASESRFRAVAEHAPDPIAEWTLEGDLVYANPRHEQDLGLGPGRSQLDLLRERVAEVDRPEFERFSADLAAGRPARTTVRARAADGGLRDFEMLGSTYENPAGERYAVVVTRDVTERRELQEQLLHAQRLDALGRLAGGVAHDFNNHLTVILGAVASLQEDLCDDSDVALHLDDVRQAAERSAALTRRLLAFGRRQTLAPRDADLGELLGNLRPLVARVVPENIELEVSLPGEPVRVNVDPVQFEQIVMNLVLNARDAMPEGGRLRVETRVVEVGPARAALNRAARPGPYAVLSVSDTGSGMDEDTQQHIFEPFFSTKKPEQGSGLGLASVHGIVRQSGGYIEFESERGVGSRFTVHLPVHARGAETAAPSRAREPSAGQGETVLVVDDEPIVLRHMCATLESGGYRVIPMADGEEAFELALSGREFDAVVTDVVMPRMSGLDLATRLREKRPDLPILFVSGNPDPNRIGPTFPEGAVLLTKPFTGRELRRALRRLVDEAAAARRASATRA